MLLTLFIVFMAITLVILALNFYAPNHLELGLVGFLFLFLLSMIVIGGDIQYKTGVNETLEYECLCCSNGLPTSSPGICTENSTNLVVSKVNKIDVYETWNGGGTLSHIVGYYLAVASIVGFIGVLLQITNNRFR